MGMGMGMGSALTTRSIKEGGEWIPTPKNLPLSPTPTPKAYPYP